MVSPSERRHVRRRFRGIRRLCRVLSLLMAGGFVADPGGAQSSSADARPSGPFARPFLAHDALAGPVGSGSARLTVIQARAGGSGSQRLGAHLQGAFLPRLQLHVRSDALRTDESVSLMVAYDLARSADGGAGLAVFGELLVPNRSGSSAVDRGLPGVAGRLTFGRWATFHGNTHLDLERDVAGMEASLVFRASEQLFPLVEGGGEIGASGTGWYLLPALKLRLGPGELGGGLKVGLGDDRDYDVQALLQVDVGFGGDGGARAATTQPHASTTGVGR